MDILEEKNISLAEAKTVLERKKKVYSKEKKELLYEQKRAIDHAKKYSKLTLKQTKDIIKKLLELDLNLNEEQVIKISDLMPETVDDIRAIFAKERFKYREEEIKRILDIVAEYR